MSDAHRIDIPNANNANNGAPEVPSLTTQLTRRLQQFLLQDEQNEANGAAQLVEEHPQQHADGPQPQIVPEPPVGVDHEEENFISATIPSFDLQQFDRWFEQALPFVALLLILWLYEHRTGILVFISLMFIFVHTNEALKKQVSLKEKRRVSVLLAVVGLLVSQIVLTYFLTREDQLWRALVLLPPQLTLVIWNVFWIIIVNDMMVRFVTMAAKAVAIALVGHRPPFKRNAQLYGLIELTGQLYRSILPVGVWVRFLSLAAAGPLVSALFTGLYLTFKLGPLAHRARSTLFSAKSFLRHEVQFGTHASVEQVAAVVNCPICQEALRGPVVLSCAHVFCEDCVAEWFERERTCPLCRAAVQGAAGLRSHTDGSTSILVQLF